MAMAREESLKEMTRRAEVLYDVQPRPVELLRTLSLAHCISRFEAMRILEADPSTDKFSERERGTVQWYIEHHKNNQLWATHDDVLPKGVGSMSLRSHEHDSLMLEWASTFLGLYSARYD